MDELENALAWFRAAPQRWIDSARTDLSAAAQWIWEVIQGDFNESQTTAQTVTSTVVSMIPFVDQICDVRDLVANCRKINEDTSNKWAWIAIVLTLIGLIPTVGSLLKGCLKIPLNAARRSAFALGKQVKDLDLWKHSAPAVEASLVKLNDFLARPAVKRTLASMRVDNVYGWLAQQVRRLAGETNVTSLLAAFDTLHEALKELLALVQKWGTAAMNTQAGQLLQLVDRIRRQADDMLRQVLKPVQDWLDKLARRLELESDKQFRASTNALNAHLPKPTEAQELAEFAKNKPVWVDKNVSPPHPPALVAPSKPGWPDISSGAKPPLRGKFDTFEQGQIHAVTIPPGEKLYRIVDPGSYDNSICWMRESEFLKLRSKADWRRKFAVWANWNSNGEFVTYVVPPGRGLNVWEGSTGSQVMRQTGGAKPDDWVLEGGGIQIVLDPADLEKLAVGRRQPTHWGYGDFGSMPSLVGVPVLKNNVRE
ncbi:MAG TPA: hypothetical protein VFK82_07655 [Burkholderiaceae bacterium]|nr:hypothetical protein [Burkholderiaceae bacterium]